jgi:hypothetical protein
MKLFKLKTSIRRKIIELFGINRQTSFPFITGDGFRSLAQHIMDEISDFKPELVEENDIIFVRGDFLRDFFKTKHTYIRCKYILISHNDDTSITEEYMEYLDDKIIHWFTKNLSFRHPKITPLPIGVTNYHYSHIRRGNISYLLKNRKRIVGTEKKNRISFGFFINCNPERVWLKELLDGMKVAEAIDEKEQFNYFKRMADFGFTISPEGNGIDCHRTWEALYFNTIPFVKRSPLTEYFQGLGIPLILIDDWKKIVDFDDESILKNKYAELKDTLENPAIYMYFWIDLILSKRI